MLSASLAQQLVKSTARGLLDPVHQVSDGLPLSHGASVCASTDETDDLRPGGRRRQRCGLPPNPLTRRPDRVTLHRHVKGDSARGPLPPPAAPHTAVARDRLRRPLTRRHSAKPGLVSGEGEKRLIWQAAVPRPKRR